MECISEWCVLNIQQLIYWDNAFVCCSHTVSLLSWHQLYRQPPLHFFMCNQRRQNYTTHTQPRSLSLIPLCHPSGPQHSTHGPPVGPAEPSTLQPSCAPSPWRRTAFFPTGSHIVPASPHARGPGTLQQAGGTSKAGRPTAAACRSSSQLQFVIIIKGLTSEASLPLFTPPSHPW